MKHFIFSLLTIFFISSPLKAEGSGDALIKTLASNFSTLHQDETTGVGLGKRWKRCFKKCMINHCSYCDGVGDCSSPPCTSIDKCPKCKGGSCKVDPGRGSELCADGCGLGCL